MSAYRFSLPWVDKSDETFFWLQDLSCPRHQAATIVLPTIRKVQTTPDEGKKDLVEMASNREIGKFLNILSRGRAEVEEPYR